MSTSRVLTGVRPTHEEGQHLGHYVGALRSWLTYQRDSSIECFFLIADIQALTTHADQPSLVREAVKALVKDWLAIGLNPELPNVHFVLQSEVSERADLSILLSMVAPWSELARNPTVKEELAKIQARKEEAAKGQPTSEVQSETVGFMTYPVDQAADIYMVAPPDMHGNELLVPVGGDQLPHLEFARDIARRFNRAYKVNLFRPCEGRTTNITRLVGLDGKDKMSKSSGNAIMLTDTPDEVRRKVMGMYTDPNRLRATDPGKVEGNPVFEYFDAFATDPNEVEQYKREYRAGKIGDVKLKERLAEIINSMLDPIRERRAAVEKAPISDILVSGTGRASAICTEVVEQAKDAMYLGFPD